MQKRITSLSILVVIGLMVLTACGNFSLLTTNPMVKQDSALPLPTQIAPAPVTSGASGDLLAAYQGTLENIYTTVSPSVVNIRVVQKVEAAASNSSQLPGLPFFNLPQGQDPQQQPQQQYQAALGSGFVWDQSGHIVTNNHVISGADKIEVAFSDGSIVSAQLVGTDPDSDLAVLKVDVAADQLHPIQLGDSTAVKVGQLAIAIGNPFGLEGTMTTGIISAVGRSIPSSETSQSYSIPDIIQTDAPINPGNSGGVLVNTEGQVLGVTAAIESPVRASAGIGFAIPSAIVNNVVPALINDGKYVHTWMGISGSTLVPDLATAMKLDPAQRGALVGEVLPNSPAEKAGLRGSSQQVTIDGQTINVGGDVITAIDGQAVVEMNDVIAYLVSNTQVGQKVTLTIIRDGNQENVDVTLAARPSAEQQNASTTAPSATNGVRLGIRGLTVDPSVAKEMNLPEQQQGVLVVQVEPGSLADTAGLRAGNKPVTINGQEINVGGDIITSINGQSVTSIEELKAALSQLTSDQKLALTLLRDGKEVDITLQQGN